MPWPDLACASAEEGCTRKMAEIYLFFFLSCCGCKTHGAVGELGGLRLEPSWALLDLLQDLNRTLLSREEVQG